MDSTSNLPLNKHGIPVDRANYEKRIKPSQKIGVARRSVSKGKRAKVLKKTDGRCAYCNVLLNRRTGKTLDHVIPLSAGGSNSLKNLVPACRRCNEWKSDMTLDEFKQSLCEGLEEREATQTS